ncbi:hypothetical protein [Gymnodinialimonas hymeniacidonis]|uniref:hypothetical protein n=1 Tax=Gymnodinialimonas hymeniacidonis TaxID=3126508 RepID=UPI0034C6D2AE
MKAELEGYYKDKFRKTGASFTLRRRHCEGEVIPTEDGKWHWWVRTPQGRYSGEAPYLSSACSTAYSIATRWEHTIPSDEEPLPVTRPDLKR